MGWCQERRCTARRTLGVTEDQGVVTEAADAAEATVPPAVPLQLSPLPLPPPMPLHPARASAEWAAGWLVTRFLRLWPPGLWQQLSGARRPWPGRRARELGASDSASGPYPWLGHRNAALRLFFFVISFFLKALISQGMRSQMLPAVGSQVAWGCVCPPAGPAGPPLTLRCAAPPHAR